MDHSWTCRINRPMILFSNCVMKYSILIAIRWLFTYLLLRPVLSNSYFSFFCKCYPTKSCFCLTNRNTSFFLRVNLCLAIRCGIISRPIQYSVLTEYRTFPFRFRKRIITESMRVVYYRYCNTLI